MQTSYFFFYGKRSDIEQIVLQDDLDHANKPQDQMIRISNNYPSFMMPASLKQDVLLMKQRNKSASSILRQIIIRLFTDIEYLANHNAQTLFNVPEMLAINGNCFS